MSRTALALFAVALVNVACTSGYLVRGVVFQPADVPGASVPRTGIPGTISERGRSRLPDVTVGVFPRSSESLNFVTPSTGSGVSDGNGEYAQTFWGDSLRGVYVEFRKPGFQTRRVELIPSRSDGSVDVRPCPTERNRTCRVVDIVLEPTGQR